MQIPGMEEIIRLALAEDIGGGDVTTLSTVPEENTSRGKFIAKEPLTVCGLPALIRVFALIDERIIVTTLKSDGDEVQKGDIIATIEGPARGTLTGERTALNLLQRLSGVATKTREAVRRVQGTNAAIVDTRKTTPGMRGLEKYAVRMGGGANHRSGLYDGVLIKDNHIRAAGGITQAIKSARMHAHHLLKIEVEVENFEQLEEALESRADTIMLDNMSLADMAEAVRRVNGRALTEASGNMGERDLSEVAKTGVDIISIGALTHSARAMDISLRFDW